LLTRAALFAFGQRPANCRCYHEDSLSLFTQSKMPAELACFNPDCRRRYAIDEVLYQCMSCDSLLEVSNDFSGARAAELKATWDQRRLSRDALDVSGVWRFREMLPFASEPSHIVTLREGNTPLFDLPRAASYGGLDRLECKHQGYNPTASFKDNGMTAGATQARKLGMQRVACVSTGNTSASMAAYAAAAGQQAVIFIPHGNIAYGKLAQALEYGALTIQVEANFDQILALVRELAGRLGIYLLNSINPFRIEGQKSIAIEMLDQRGWRVPDWIVLPGGNLGNVSALGKAVRELKEIGVIDKLPRFAVVQAEGAAPLYQLFQKEKRDVIEFVENPETLATAIRIGAPVSWLKAKFEVESSGGLVGSVSEQEIADAKAIIGRCGIGCEPASAATLAGIRKFTAAGRIPHDADVVAVLTGHLLKDPDYVYRYHTGQLKAPDGRTLESTFGNKPVVMPNDASRIARFLEEAEKSAAQRLEPSPATKT
jgi:threonine synthase